MQSHPRLQHCVVFCAQCRIRFLTHPRCAGRVDLRCPFGCRRRHRRQRSNERSTAYYQTPSGKRLKKRLNARRSCKSQPATDKPAPPVDRHRRAAEEPATAEPPVKVELRLQDVVLCESTLRTSPVLPYIRMIVDLVEGARLNSLQLLELLLRSMRQHSIAYQNRTDYVLRFLHRRPP